MDYSAQNDYERESLLDLQRVNTETKPFQHHDNTVNSSFAEEVLRTSEEYKKLQQKMTTNIQKDIEEVRKIKKANDGVLD